MEGRIEKLEKWKEETIKWMHAKDISDSGTVNNIVELRKDMDELLDNSRWMKRAWATGVITLVISVVSALIIGVGALIWFIASK